jgi:hypothetical protein
MTNQQHSKTNPARQHLIHQLKQLTRQLSPAGIPASLFPLHQPIQQSKQRRTWTARDILDALNKLVNEHGEHITRAGFHHRTGIPITAIIKHFGTFTELRRRAGLQPNPHSRNRYTDEQLLEHYHQVAQKLGRIPTELDFERHAPVSIGTLKRRFGNKQQVECRYAEFKQTRKSPL